MMQDSLTVARLTLMLLRASWQQGDSLPSSSGVIINNSTTVLTIEEAVEVLARSEGPVNVSAEIRGSNLVISMTPPSHQERASQDLTKQTFVKGLHNLGIDSNNEARIRVVGIDEDFVITVRVLKMWLDHAHCDYCSLGLGRPASQDSPDIRAVLYLGKSRR